MNITAAAAWLILGFLIGAILMAILDAIDRKYDTAKGTLIYDPRSNSFFVEFENEEDFKEVAYCKNKVIFKVTRNTPN